MDQKSRDKKFIREIFKSLLKPEAIEILSDINNYSNTLACQLCNEPIKKPSHSNYFHLYPLIEDRFVAFHFACALKPGTADQFNEIAGDFDYVYDITSE